MPFLRPKRSGTGVADADAEMAVRMTGFADDAGVVAARGQHEGQLAIVEQVQLEHRMPGRDMVALRPHDEHRQLDVAQRQRAAGDLEAPLCKIVVEEQASQILDMHARRQTGAIGIPGHQVVRRIVLAEQIVADRVRPDEVVRSQHLERAAHLSAVQKSLGLHDVVEKIELILGDEQLQVAGLGEIGLGGKQRQARQPSRRCRAPLRRRRCSAMFHRGNSRWRGSSHWPQTA